MGGNVCIKNISEGECPTRPKTVCRGVGNVRDSIFCTLKTSGSFQMNSILYSRQHLTYIVESLFSTINYVFQIKTGELLHPGLVFTFFGTFKKIVIK